jgi:hypothetical protein
MKKELKDRKLRPHTLATLLVAQCPADWQASTGTGWHDGMECWTREVDEPGRFHHVVFQRDGVLIALNITLPSTNKFSRKWDLARAFAGCLVEGHTTFDGKTFTRRGVDVSSCELRTDEKERYEHQYGSLLALLDGEYARCVKAREKAKTAVPVPGLPFTVQPEWFDTTAQTLRAGRSVNLTPSGMGTGYTLRKGTPRHKWVHRASPDLEQRLGVSPITVEQFDHD